MGIAKNKSPKSGMFFAPEKRPSTSHKFTTNPPQIHHQKTTFNHPFLPKPPAKTHNHHAKNKRPDKVFVGPFIRIQRRGRSNLYWLKFGSSSSSMP
jgi:hypothetical protein